MLATFPLLLALSGSDALAAKSEDDGPWMWGVGPTVGTIVYPGRFPAKLPAALDGLGDVNGDVKLGGHGMVYLDAQNRLGTHVDFGLGKGFSSIAWTLEYERVLVRGGGFHVFAGAGGGFGKYKFSNDTVGTLKVPTYEIRGQLGAMYKQHRTAEELSIFLKVPFNGNPTFTDLDGVDSDSNGGNLLHLGMELTVYYGDFKVKKGK